MCLLGPGWKLLDARNPKVWKDLRAVYVCSSRSIQETDRPFPEPSRFAINPAGQAQIFDISNAQFARQDLGGILLIQSRDHLVRDMLA